MNEALSLIWKTKKETGNFNSFTFADLKPYIFSSELKHHNMQPGVYITILYENIQCKYQFLDEYLSGVSKQCVMLQSTVLLLMLNLEKAVDFRIPQHHLQQTVVFLFV